MLYVLAHGGHLAVVEALVKAAAAVDQAYDNGTTSLFVAAEKGHLTVMKALVKTGPPSIMLRATGRLRCTSQPTVATSRWCRRWSRWGPP